VGIAVAVKGKAAGKRPVSNPVHIKDLKPDPDNLREHNPRNIGLIADTLQSVGAARSIVIDDDDVILAGNGVVEAAGQAGITKVRVIEADGSEIIAVRRRGLTDQQKLDLAIADNRANELSAWKPDALALLVANGVDTTKYWTAAELAKMLRHTVAEGHTAPDAVPATRATSIQRGDAFQLGRHYLVCGDSTNLDDVQKAKQGQAMDACITDPPYGIGLEYSSHDDDDNAANEQLVIDALAFAPSCRVWTPGKMNLARELARHPQAKVVCWYKKFSAAGNGMGGASTWEPILVVGSAGAHLSDDHLEHPTDREPGLHALHPCPKPVGLWVTLLNAFSPVGGHVYEPFSGSGTTLIAGEQTGRSVHALEIDPQYVQVAIDRWEEFTHASAVKL
jgi:hypothetical protein